MTNDEVKPALVAATGDDAIAWGAAGIGRVIGRTPRQTIHLLESGRLPAKKVGGYWAARVKALLDHFNAEVC
jgi:hypothetical protein